MSSGSIFSFALPLTALAATVAACAHDAAAPSASGGDHAPPGSASSASAVAAETLHAPQVPDVLRVPPAEAVTARASADGAQIYECQSGANGAFAWKLVGPDAVLTDATGGRLGRHYAGPTWEALDGSKVVGSLEQKVDAPGGGAIPWLLLGAKSTEGTGRFAKVTHVQRVDTVGGVAPASGCDGAKVGTKQNVPYRATYYFYARSG